MINSDRFGGADASELISGKLSRLFGVQCAEASREQMFTAVTDSVRDILASRRASFRERAKKCGAKRLSYFSMEFLLGPMLKNNLKNLSLEDEYREALRGFGFDLDELYEYEVDPGLGNGGLGRLAACFMDSLTTLGCNAAGYSILYEYGLFSQRIVHGNQIEQPDDWLRRGNGWLKLRTDKIYPVRFGGYIKERWENGRCIIEHSDYEEIDAVAYDMYISGASQDNVNILRLWSARSRDSFDMRSFSRGQYAASMQRESRAAAISKLLYPSDDHEEGKLLRLSQQYFLVSASLQSIIADHLTRYGSLDSFDEKNALHINDTHPALLIPELMRILMDVYSYSWERAWSVVCQSVTYTNHTVMPEALESWQSDMFRMTLPRIYAIIDEINKRECAELWRLYPGDWDRISRMAIISHSRVKMANLSCCAARKINGVSAMHGDILKKSVFRDYYKYSPQKFTYVTNGIAHRRWLAYANPALAELITSCIGDEYMRDPIRLSEFAAFADDTDVLSRLAQIKHERKALFSEHIQRDGGRAYDCDSLFDVHVKRIHEYKRQLLSVLKILVLSEELRSGELELKLPVTFIFGGKAAPGYYLAKEIIRLIWSVGEEIRRDAFLSEYIRVDMLEDYRVSSAELLIPSADLSEQISLAGKEASGTGCMKFLINGALTIGTADGANIEIAERVGGDNIYMFGMSADESEELWRRGYDASAYCKNDPKIAAAIDRLRRGFAGNDFTVIADYLTSGRSVADPFMCLGDLGSYMSAYKRALKDHGDSRVWQSKAVKNIAGAGYFSADRAIREYCRDIWQLSAVEK